MRISDWSSDVCSSDLATHRGIPPASDAHPHSAACRWLPWRAIWPANLSGVRSTCPLYEGATLYFSLNFQRTLFGQAAKRPVFPVLEDRKNTRLKSSHLYATRLPSSTQKKNPKQDISPFHTHNPP